MRILHVTAQKPFATGSGSYLCSLVGAFRELGLRQALVYGLEAGEIPPLSFRDCVRGLELFPVYYGSEKLPFPVLGMSDVMPYASKRYRDLNASELRYFQKTFLDQIQEAVRQFKPDVILSQHLFLLTAFIREAFPSIPVYGICHETCLMQTHRHPHHQSWLTKQIADLDGIFALHEQQRDNILRLHPEAKDRITITGTAYDEAYFYSNKPPLLRVPEGPFRLIYAGKLSFLKGVPYFLRALQELDESFQLTLIGSSSSKEEEAIIQELIAKANYPIEVHPRLPLHQLLPFYEKHHLFILPSLKEGLPLVVLEALASGLAVLMSGLPGLPSWFRDHLPEGDGLQFFSLEGLDISDEHQISPLFEERLRDSLRQMMHDLRNRGLLIPDVRELSRLGLAKKILKVLTSP